MSGKSKRSARAKAKAIDRPFEADLLRKDRRIAREHQVILEQQADGWYGRGLELPLVMADGPTPTACVRNVREALCGAVALMLEQAQSPPAPACMGKRTCQMNVRLFPEERARLEAAAKRLGFPDAATIGGAGDDRLHAS